MVVLLLLSLVAGVAFPRLMRVYDATKTRYQRDDVLAQISALGYLAYQRGQMLELRNSTATLPLLSLPQGWSMQAEAPIIYTSNGVCEGGKIVLIYGESRVDIELPPPYCQPQIL